MDWEKISCRLSGVQGKTQQELKEASNIRIFIFLGFLFFLLPWCTISYDGQQILKISGIDLVTGFTYGGVRFGSSIYAVGSSICACLGLYFVGIQVGRLKLFQKRLKEPQLLNAKLLCFASMIFLILFRVTLAGQIERSGYFVLIQKFSNRILSRNTPILSFSLGWYLTILAFFIAFYSNQTRSESEDDSVCQSEESGLSTSVVDAASESALKVPTPYPQPKENDVNKSAAERYMPMPVSPKTDEATADPQAEDVPLKASRFCTNCGSPVSGRFCTNCGQRISED